MQNSSVEGSSPASSLEGRYLTFRLSSESYGIGVMAVQEIIRFESVTAVPQLPAHIRGVINLRGRVVPVVDLRIRFGLPISEDNTRTCIIVVQIVTSRGRVPMGLLVDAVEEVLNVSRNDVAPPPEFGCAVDVAFLRGMARVRDQIKTLLDLDRVLTDQQIDGLRTLAA